MDTIRTHRTGSTVESFGCRNLRNSVQYYEVTVINNENKNKERGRIVDDKFPIH